MKVRSILLFAVLLLFILAGCGGGGSSSAPPAPTQPTTARLTLSTQGTLPTGSLIGGIDIIVNLPAGVTVRTETASSTVNSTVLVASGQGASGSLVLGNYTAATATAPGMVRILLVNAAGFGVGEYATLTCDIAAGTTPRSADFSLTGFTPIEASSGTPAITTLTPTFTAEIR